MRQTKFVLTEKELPTQWYNIQADMKNRPGPALHPQTKEPMTYDDMKLLLPHDLIMQEISEERWVPIPEPVLNIYALWRPTPLFRAHRLEEALGTPAHIYYKYEGVSPAGSHKPNTAIPIAYYNKVANVRRICTETGAGQWGSALSLACNLFGLDCLVYMVKISAEQKPYRRSLMRSWGANVIASPSDTTNSGRLILERDPDSPGSLNTAMAEAIEVAATHADTTYALGSGLNHVFMHQTIMGLEAKKQMAMAGEYPDVIFGACGGGSNFAGLSFPFLADKLAGTRDPRVVAVEPAACPTLTRGIYAYDHVDAACVGPLLPMYTLGHSFTPAKIHAGGLRFHGDGPLVCQLYKDGMIGAEAYRQLEVFKAAVTFARSEGIVPAPESAHAICAALAEAQRCKEAGEQKTILFGLSGHGHFDLKAYDEYFDGTLEDYVLPQEEIGPDCCGGRPNTNTATAMAYPRRSWAVETSRAVIPCRVASTSAPRCSVMRGFPRSPAVASVSRQCTSKCAYRGRALRLASACRAAGRPSSGRPVAGLNSERYRGSPPQTDGESPGT